MLGGGKWDERGGRPVIFKMKIKDITIGLVSSKCDLLGKCKDKIDKPFLCRAYPFLPVYDYNNKLKTLIPASIFDIIYQIKEFTSPCKVNDFQKNFDHYNDNKFFLNLDVYSKFYLKVLEIFYKVIKKNILMETKNFTKNNKKFWRVFEKLYLSGLIFSSSTLKNDIYKEYLKTVDFDKNFNLLDEERYLSF